MTNSICISYIAVQTARLPWHDLHTEFDRNLKVTGPDRLQKRRPFCIQRCPIRIPAGVTDYPDVFRGFIQLLASAETVPRNMPIVSHKVGEYIGYLVTQSMSYSVS